MKDNVKTVSEVCGEGQDRRFGRNGGRGDAENQGLGIIDDAGQTNGVQYDRSVHGRKSVHHGRQNHSQRRDASCSPSFHVHNYGQRSNKNYVLSNGAGTEDLHVGKGWKLNVQQYMLPTGKTADGEIAYIYVDALGNEIGFAADKRYLQTGDAVIERTEFKDVEGMGLTYRDLTLRDRQGNRLFFDGDGKLIKIEADSATEL